MNILMMAPEFPPAGGIGTRSYESALNLVRLGHRLTVLTAVPKADFKKTDYQGLNIINLSWLRKWSESGSIGFVMTVTVFSLYSIYLARDRRINLCYSTLINVGLSALWIQKLFRIPYLVAIHGMEVSNPSYVGRKWITPVLRNAAGLIILAERQHQSLLNMGVPDGKIYLIPEGINIDKFSIGEKDGKIIDRYNLEGKKVLLTVGRLVKRKGQDMVIKSLPNVLEKVPEAVYLIIGSGPEEETLKSLVAEFGLEDAVIFTGYVPDDDLLAYYSVCDVFIMASREIGADIEGFGIVFLEASACGKPVIGGKSGGIGDAVEDGVSGILVDPESVADITATITRLLLDDELAEEIGRRGRERVEKEFGDKAVAVKINKMLDEVTGIKNN